MPDIQTGAVGGGDALTTDPLSQFAATTSAQLAGVISDETGSGALVFATSPTLVTPALGTPSALVLTSATGLPTAGLVDDAVTLAKMAAGTAGNLITYDASGDPAAVATGTATHVLTSNGAGAAPTFQAVAGASVASATVAGADTTTLLLTHTFTADKLYYFSGKIVSKSTAAYYYLYYNADTTATNYRTGYIYSGGSGIQSTPLNMHCDAAINDEIKFWGTIQVSSGFVEITCWQCRPSDSAGRLMVQSSRHISATGLTSIQFTSDVALKIGIGSFVKTFAPEGE